MTRLTIGPFTVGWALASVFAASWALAQSDPRHSGYQDMGPDLRRMQDDDTANPAMLFVQAGQALWQEKAGTANKACADCHQDAAKSMKGVAARYPAIPAGTDKGAGATIPQGHPTGYPIYRLEWQTLGSLKRRLRNCLVGMRAETWDWDDPQYVALELYLMDRARGMTLDAPAVRP